MVFPPCPQSLQIGVLLGGKENTFPFFKRKGTPTTFLFYKKNGGPTTFLVLKRNRAQIPIFFSGQGIRVSRYKNANIHELWVVSSVAFSWLCFRYEPKKMFFFVRGQGYIKERWPLIYELLSDLESGWLDARPANTLDQCVTTKKQNYSTRYLHTYTYINAG